METYLARRIFSASKHENDARCHSTSQSVGPPKVDHFYRSPRPWAVETLRQLLREETELQLPPGEQIEQQNSWEMDHYPHGDMIGMNGFEWF